MSLAQYIDHTILKNRTTVAQVESVCVEATVNGFAAVCIPPSYVEQAVWFLEGIDVKIATVIGFPFGYHDKSVKAFEATKALADGADELDVVVDIGSVKGHYWQILEDEVKALTEVTTNRAVLKLIIESGILTDEEIIKCCELYSRYPVQFLKTSTGFGGDGASVHAVELMRNNLPPDIQIKASGGIRTKAFAEELIAAGATRLGTSSGLSLVNGEAPLAGY